MPDDKSKVKEDRKRIAKNEPYEMSYFKKKHDLTKEQALKIIEKHGNNREAANKAAEKLKSR
jgi:DNA-directed RNA polymerase subunit L